MNSFKNKAEESQSLQSTLSVDDSLHHEFINIYLENI